MDSSILLPMIALMQNPADIKSDPAFLRAHYVHLLAGGDVTKSHTLLSGKAFWENAWGEGVGACIWHALQEQDIALDEAVRAQCVEQPLRDQIPHTLLLRAVAGEMLRLFAEAGVDVIMLRGQALADVLYSPATLRPQADIDLMMVESDTQQVVSLLEKAGFSHVPHHSLLFVRGEVLLDMHIEPLGIERITSWALLTPLRAEDFFHHSHRGPLLGVDTLHVDEALLLPYLSFHAMKHSFERLIWLWDIALLARRIGEADAWQALQHGIESFALQRPCFYALSYVDAHLAAPVPASLLDALRPDMDWRERQIFRRFMRHVQVPFLAERVFARMQPDVLHRMAFWKETIFPSAKVRQQVNVDPSAKGGFWAKRFRQISSAALILLRELGTLFRP